MSCSVPYSVSVNNPKADAGPGAARNAAMSAGSGSALAAVSPFCSTMRSSSALDHSVCCW